MKNKTARLPDFERSLPMTLLRARESVMLTFIPHLKKHGLSPQQWRVMRLLAEHDEMDMSGISKQSYLLLPSLSRIIRNLESRDIVSRRTEQKDLRKSVISLTLTGHQLVREIAPESETRYQHITETFGYGKLELLYDLLEELVDKLDSNRFEQSAVKSKRGK